MNDFEKKLKNPPLKYRPAPFWSWNEKLDVEETKNQIRVMKEAGMGGFFMHARGGLQTEYLSREWFDNVSASINEGENCGGMLAFGYDENGWPSGSGNGAVTDLGEEYQQKYLRCDITETPFEDEHTLANVKIDGRIYHCFYEVNPFYVDTLNGDTIKEFLKSTHQKYREVLGNDFKKLKGFFTDEPQASRNGIPWSFNLKKQYEAIYGEPISEHLPKLFFKIKGYEEFRFRFWRLVRDLFTDSFMGVIGKWCKENGSALTGHMVLEEDYYEHILANGACMPSYEYMDIPGMDHLCRGMPSVQTEMQLTSVANQLGKKQILSETFAACGWNVSFEDMRKIYEHQMVHGVNLLCQHLEGYSLRGIRKRDYPASLFRHQPWWKEYKTFNDAVSRIGMLIAEGEVRFNILVLHTIESGWLVSDDRAKADGYAKELNKVLNALEDAQFCYHLGDSRIIKRHGAVKNGRFNIGTQSYSAVIVPPAKCLDDNTFNMLAEFKKQGGTVIFTGEIPEYINGIKSDKVLNFSRDCVVSDPDSLPGNIPADCSRVRLKTDTGDSKNIRSTVRYFENGKTAAYYICNFGDSENCVILTAKGKSAAVFDAVSGDMTPALYKAEGENVIAKTVIPQNSSAVIFVYETEKYAPAKPETKQNALDVSDKLKGEWQVLGADDNSITLDYCDLSVGGETVALNMPVSDVQETLCAYGRAVDARMVFRFNIKKLAFKNCRLMLETPEIFDIILNGNRVENKVIGSCHDLCFKLIDVYKYLKEGENELCLSCQFKQSETTYEMLDKLKYFESVKNKLTYDMEIEAVYLKGDFGVFAENGFEHIERGAVRTKGGFYLDKAPNSVYDGAVETQGYPFFAGSITLKKSIVLSPDEAKGAYIAFSAPPSIVTDIKVNGKGAGKIMWRPYRADISDLVREGENDIEITLTGSLRNLLGPFHLDEGETHIALPFYFFKKTGIWGWGDGVNGKWTDDYSFVKNGIFLS